MIFYYLLVLSLPLVNHPIFGAQIAGVTVVKYVGLVCLAYAAFSLLGRRRSPEFLGTAQARAFLAFFCLVVVSYVLHGPGVAGVGWGALTGYISHVGFFFTTVVLVTSLERLRRVMLVAVGSMALASLYVLREWWGGSAVYGADYRPGYVTGDPNFFAASALVCLPMAFVWTLEGRPRWERIYCLGCLLLGLAGTMVAASRGGFVGLLAGLTLLTWHSRYRIKALTVVGGIMAMALLISPTSPVKRLLDPTHGDVEARDARFQLWTAGLRMVKAHPLLGVGIGNFKTAAGAYGGIVGDVQFISHNGYLDVAAELGLPALLALLAVMFFSFRTASKIRRQTRLNGPPVLHQTARGIEAGLLGFAVALFFVSGLFLKLFWLMVFSSMCLPQLQARTRTEEAARAA